MPAFGSGRGASRSSYETKPSRLGRTKAVSEPPSALELRGKHLHYLTAFPILMCRTHGSSVCGCTTQCRGLQRLPEVEKDVYEKAPQGCLYLDSTWLGLLTAVSIVAWLPSFRARRITSDIDAFTKGLRRRIVFSRCECPALPECELRRNSSAMSLVPGLAARKRTLVLLNVASVVERADEQVYIADRASAQKLAKKSVPMYISVTVRGLAASPGRSTAASKVQ